jgi:hypothetical protein
MYLPLLSGVKVGCAKWREPLQRIQRVWQLQSLTHTNHAANQPGYKLKEFAFCRYEACTDGVTELLHQRMRQIFHTWKNSILLHVPGEVHIDPKTEVCLYPCGGAACAPTAKGGIPPEHISYVLSSICWHVG